MGETRARRWTAAERARRRWRIQGLRYLSQFGFLVFIVWVMIGRIVGPESGPNAAASPESYCPLGGFETLYKYITSGGTFVAHTHLSNMVLFIALVATAVIGKGFFCGWVCPLGAMQQAITGARRWVQRRWAPLDGFAKWLSSRTRRYDYLDRWLRYGKYAVLAWIIWGTITYGVMVFRDVDPWAAFIELTASELTIGFGFVVLVGTLVAALVGDRVWCRYACPLGAIVGILGKIGLMKVQREDSACIGCGLCSKKCPMNIPVDTKSRVGAAECNMCLECVAACPVKGALDVKLAVPGLPAGRESGATEVAR